MFWRKIYTPLSPSPRRGISACESNDSIYFFAGRESTIIFNDLLTYDIGIMS